MEQDEIYRKKQCEICGQVVYEKYLGVVNELDGGYTKIHDWENSGFGKIQFIYNAFGIENKHEQCFSIVACPKCASMLDSKISSFAEEIKTLFYTENNET